MARPRSNIAPRILHAARDEFLRVGVDGASLRRIAAVARTSIGMVYYYFPAKEDLFLAVVEEVYARLLADMSVALAQGATVAERVTRLYERLGRMPPDEVAVVQLVVREMFVSSARRKRLVDRFLHGHVPLIMRMLEEGRAGGELTTAHPQPVLGLSLLALGLFPQVIRRLVGDALPPGFPVPAGEELSRALAGVVMNGIRAR